MASIQIPNYYEGTEVITPVPFLGDHVPLEWSLVTSLRS